MESSNKQLGRAKTAAQDLKKFMESRDKQLGRAKISKSSHAISKLKTASRGATSSSRITPTIRIVHIFAPTIVKTDPDNFRALVQKLTGRDPDCSLKKPTQNKNSPQRPASADFKNSPISHADHSHNPTADGENLNLKQDNGNEFVWCGDQFTAARSEIKKESMGDAGVTEFDYFSELFSGFEEQNFLASLVMSDSMLPEIPMIFPPVT